MSCITLGVVRSLQMQALGLVFEAEASQLRMRHVDLGTLRS